MTDKNPSPCAPYIESNHATFTEREKAEIFNRLRTMENITNNNSTNIESLVKTKDRHSLTLFGLKGDNGLTFNVGMLIRYENARKKREWLIVTLLLGLFLEVVLRYFILGH